MQIIVDGYNFIGRDKGLRGDLEEKRRRLIEQLSAYRRIKGFLVSVIFDGKEGGEDRFGGVDVIFSGYGESADEVICRMAARLGESCTVVSSDREIQRRVRESGGVAVRTGEFETRLISALHPTSHPSPQEGKEEIENDANPPPDKRGNPHRLAKAKRRLQKRLKRL